MPEANLALIDTSVYIDNLRSGRFKQETLDFKFVVRCSAVVFAELSRGSRSRPMRKFVDDLAKNLRIIKPNERQWLQSGTSLTESLRYQQNHGISFRGANRALTARRIGAHLITCNIADFTAIRETLTFNLTCV